MRPPLLPARLLPGDSGIHWQGSESTSITLREGELRKAPTVQAGAIRLRLLDKVFGQPVEKGEFMLQIAAEPNLGWRKATALRIDKAVDDREQQWQFLSLDAGSSFKIAMDVATRTPEIAPAFGGLIPLLLKNGDESAKSLKELKGVITAEVLSRPKTLLTIEDVRKVNDETFELPGGGVCKIRAKRATANELLVDVEFIEMPPSAGPQKVFTCVLSTGDEGSEEERKMDVNISPPEIVRQRIHIALAKNSKPLRLVLRRQHVLTLRIPFTFKDVPLP